jgi:Ca2+-binding RTX toxin-like protein
VLEKKGQNQQNGESSTTPTLESRVLTLESGSHTIEIANHNSMTCSGKFSAIFDDLAVTPLYCGEPESYYSNVINGTDSADYLVGTNQKDLIFGNGGNDFIRGFGDDDCIYAGDGDDLVFGAGGNDIIYGEDGNDNIRTGKGNDTIYGGNGNDIIRTYHGNDIVYGEDGDDILHATITIGTNTLDGGSGSDMCIPGTDKVQVTNIDCEITS